ncbi:hypothetical protein T11_2186 [Trichinella zimbabwensis]|uniref:Uncharacterized protein n=1 Tax=Trichinella zimbabwensis TaxID=268475 RepID=A0A0V1GUW3_9BILA|nr:hypothetical protein T11_2186 [Trichinella zimbabwensis]
MDDIPVNSSRGAMCTNLETTAVISQKDHMASVRWMSTLLIKWKRRQFERKRAQKKHSLSPLFMIMERPLIYPPLTSSRSSSLCI